MVKALTPRACRSGCVAMTSHRRKDSCGIARCVPEDLAYCVSTGLYRKEPARHHRHRRYRDIDAAEVADTYFALMDRLAPMYC